MLTGTISRVICGVHGVLIVPHSRLRNGNAISKVEPQFKDLYMFHALHELQERGIAVTICSNVTSVQAEAYTRKGVYSPFKDVVLSCNVGVRKPELVWQLGADPSKTLLIDSRPVNIDMARRIGMMAVLYGNNEEVFELSSHFHISQPDTPRFMPVI